MVGGEDHHYRVLIHSSDFHCCKTDGGRSVPSYGLFEDICLGYVEVKNLCAHLRCLGLEGHYPEALGRGEFERTLHSHAEHAATVKQFHELLGKPFPAEGPEAVELLSPASRTMLILLSIFIAAFIAAKCGCSRLV